MANRHCLLFIFLIGVAIYSSHSRLAAQEKADPTLTAWLVDWDAGSGRDEAMALGSVLASTQIFAAYFDENDNPYIPEKYREWLRDNREELFRNSDFHLTIVNDIVPASGESAEKDPDLLSRLLATPEARERHRHALVDLAESVGCAGLDIDYERIKSEDWPAFLDFAAGLDRDLSSRGLALRVVLEPKKLYLETPLPKGPEYVLMAYNLFGGHSGPGPKADPEFIFRLREWCENGGNTMRLALSAGGFVWRENGKTRSVTENQAAELALQNDVKMRRDPISLYLNYSYQDENGETFTVWYADGVTFRNLIQAGRAADFTDFALWRLGGNARETIAVLGEMFNREQKSNVYYVDASASISGNGLAFASPFATLAEAIQAARDGDTILVQPGIYHENLVIDKKLTIQPTPAYDQGTPVKIVGKGSAATLAGSGRSVWKGVEFSNSGDNDLLALGNFSGRFEHCAFRVGGTAEDEPGIRLSQSDVSFHACAFFGNGGGGLSFAGYNEAESRAKRWIDFTYCFFTGFGGDLVAATGDLDIRFAHCLATRNNRILSRTTHFTGAASIINSLLYFNESAYIANDISSLTPIRIVNTFYTPYLNNRLWVMAPRLEAHPGIDAENISQKSPRFNRIGRTILLNLGIDDTINIGVWQDLAKIAQPFGYAATLAINTGVATEKDWQDIRDTFATGNEIGSHTSSHASMRTTPPLTIGYLTPEVQDARLSIVQGKTLVIRSGGEVVFEVALDEPGLNINRFTRNLGRMGINVVLSPYHAGVPPTLLEAVDDLDIAFPNPVVPLYLDTEKFLEFELATSMEEIRAHFTELDKIPFINPFAINSPVVKKALHNVGYYCARSDVEEEESGGVGPDGKAIFNVYNIPSISFNNMQTAVPDNDVIETMLQVLDYVKTHFYALSIYSHSPRELSIESWGRVLTLLSRDPDFEVVTLTEMAGRIREKGKNIGQGVYELKADAPMYDFHPRPDSPLIGAGLRLGIGTDFEGKALPLREAPTVGLYQFQK